MPITKTYGNGNLIINEGSDEVIIIGNGTDTITAGDRDTITVGGGNDTITIGSHDTLTVGNGSVKVTAGSDDTIQVGNGNDIVTAGANAAITAGQGSSTISAGANSSITAGDGNNSLTAGPNSTITGGNGPDTVHAGANTVIKMGNGPDNISAGTSDTITIGRGADEVSYDGLTPNFSVPKSLSVNEENSIALPITLLPPSLGNEVVNGFNFHNDVIRLDTADFANFTDVINHASQVGLNTVITQPGGGGTITLTNVNKSSLTTANFQFFSGTASDVITVTGVPLDATLSAGTNDGGGMWTLTPAQLAGLQLNAGEPIGYPTPVDLKVNISNPSGQGASSTQDTSLVVNPIAPTVGVSVLARQAGDPVTETRLQLSSAVDDGDGGNDYINRIVLSGVPTGVNLSSPTATITSLGGGSYEIDTTGNPSSFNPEVDVTTPSGQTTNFNLGITAYADEPHAPEVSSSTTQNIDVEYKTISQNPDFQSVNQSIWNTGTAFTKSFSTFLGIDYPNGFPNTAGPASTSTSVLGVNFGATFGLKAGFQADLNVNAGSFNGQLPFNVTLNDTFNKTTNTLEIDPSESQLGGGGFTTQGPGGSLEIDLVFDVIAKAHGGPLNLTLSTFVDKVLIQKNSSTLGHSFSLPDGLGSVTVNWPQVNTTGSNPNPGTIEATGTSKPIFNLNIDPIAVVLDAILGSDPLKGSVGSLPGVQISYTILAATLAPGVDVQQTFDLNASGLTPVLKNGSGTTIPFSFGSPTILQSPSNTNFSLGLTPDTTLENQTSLAGQLEIGLRALKGSITVGLTPPLTTSVSVGPLIHPHTTFGPAPFVTLYQNTFPVNFQPQTVTFNA
jgi:hypothetical protein